MLSPKKFADALRVLSIDAVQKAGSGHPGMPLGMADIAAVLWREFLRFNPKNPDWINRDRFVLSNGHGVALLYAALHLTGYDLTREDLKAFRQLHSRTPGHPEYGETPGVEATTGPLGQGLGMAVGMAVAERGLAAQFNRKDFSVIDHFTYVFAGDGCLMEGISHEVCALAGTLQLGKLIVFYDDNGISIDGPVQNWFTDNTAERFRAYGWQVIERVDGHDAVAIRSAIQTAQKQSNQPSLIICKTIIGAGSPKANSAAVHGAPLGEAGVAETRANLGWEFPPFEIPPEIAAAWDRSEEGQQREKRWSEQFQAYQQAYPTLAEELLRRMQGDCLAPQSPAVQEAIESLIGQQKPMATRKASQMALALFGAELPELFGGSADLTESNCTVWSGSKAVTASDFSGNYVHYGVREFGMAAMSNGLALHGGWIPYCATFLVFSDYARNAIRLSALMRQRVLYLLTHDSIGLGEDGPTHQPVEQATSLRIMPQVEVWRPCDLAETLTAWQVALTYAGPSCLLLSRQVLPAQLRKAGCGELIQRGGYTLYEPATLVQGLFIATGSEVALAREAAEQLYSTHGVGVRVVSMPCVERFRQQTREYREAVLPRSVTARVAVEAGVSTLWREFVGESGRVIGMDSYGKSAPAEALYKDFGFTVEQVQAVMLSLVKPEVEASSAV